MNFRGHFKKSRFHSIQNCDFKLCVCHWHIKTLRILRLLYSRGEEHGAKKKKKLMKTTAKAMPGMKLMKKPMRNDDECDCYTSAESACILEQLEASEQIERVDVADDPDPSQVVPPGIILATAAFPPAPAFKARPTPPRLQQKPQKAETAGATAAARPQATAAEAKARPRPSVSYALAPTTKPKPQKAETAGKVIDVSEDDDEVSGSACL